MCNLSKIHSETTIREGSIFYFTEESFKTDEPHYFVTVHHTPLKDGVLFLVCAVTFDAKVYERIDRGMKYRSLPKETFVDVMPEECEVLKSITLFDCNNIFEKDIEIFIDKLSKKELKMHGCIESDILGRLRRGVIKSPQVTREIKKILKAIGNI